MTIYGPRIPAPSIATLDSAPSSITMLNKVKQSLHKHFLPPDLHKSLNAPEGVVRPKVWLDVVRGEDSNDTKRIEIGTLFVSTALTSELFSDIVPKCATSSI